MAENILTLCYLIASVTFIIGLKMLSNPATARKGNLLAAGGMAVAIAGTIFLYEEDGRRLGNYAWIFGGILVGSVIGTLSAKKVKMTAMPEMVSMFNGMGGACAALISLVEFDHLARLDFQETVVTSYVSHLNAITNIVSTAPVSSGTLLIILLGLIIGSVSFSGSVIAWGKLNGKIKDFSFKGQHIVNLLILAVIVTLAVIIIALLPQNGLRVAANVRVAEP